MAGTTLLGWLCSSAEVMADLGGTNAPATATSQCAAADPSRSCDAIDPNPLGTVQPFSGEYVLEEEDMRIPGVGLDFVWRRIYLSREHENPGANGWEQPPEMMDVYSALGFNWDYSYNIRIHGFGYAVPCGETSSMDLTELSVHDGHGRVERWLEDYYCENGFGVARETWSRPERFETITAELVSLATLHAGREDFLGHVRCRWNAEPAQAA